MTLIFKPVWKFPIISKNAPDAWAFFRAFANWIPDAPEVYVDVADYRHVPGGVQIILVGHYHDVVLDASDGILGVAFSVKRPQNGDDATQLATSLNQALAALARLETDPIFSGILKFDRARFSLTINDRAKLTNDQNSLAALSPSLTTALKEVFPGKNHELSLLATDPRRRLSVVIRSS